MKAKLFQFIENNKDIFTSNWDLNIVANIGSIKIQHPIQLVEIFNLHTKHQNNSSMNDKLTLKQDAQGICPASDQTPLISTEQARSAQITSLNRHKWQMIYLFIIIISMQGICNLVLVNTDSQLIISNSTFKVPPVVPGNSAEWRGNGDRYTPPQNLRISLFKPDVIKTASDAGYRQFAFYQNTLNTAILYSYLTQQKS